MTEETETTTAIVAMEPTDTRSLELMAEVDVEGMRRGMERFHEFVKSLLKENVHYGKMPGVNKNFLWQPGAEEIFRAFNCRPSYSTVSTQIDANTGWVFFHRKCEAIHINTGSVVSEADAICSSEEFRRKDGEMQPLSKVLSNALMKADKRAFVKAARTLGCASEFFTQDEDLVDNGDGGGGAAPRRKGTGTPAPNPVTGDARAVGYWEADSKKLDRNNKPTLRIMCPSHGWWFATEWGGRNGMPVTIKCNKKLDDGDYCEFQVPKNASKPSSKAASAPTTKPQAPSIDVDHLMSLLADKSPLPDGRGMHIADLETVVNPPFGTKLSPRLLTQWLAKDPSRTLESLVDAAYALIPGTASDGDDEADPSPDDAPIDGEFTEEDSDDLPFE